MPKPVLPTCPETSHRFVISDWEVVTKETRAAVETDVIESMSVLTQRAKSLLCTRCLKVMPAPT